jgi:hypothetical protein
MRPFYGSIKVILDEISFFCSNKSGAPIVFLFSFVKFFFRKDRASGFNVNL